MQVPAATSPDAVIGLAPGASDAPRDGAFDASMSRATTPTATNVVPEAGRTVPPPVRGMRGLLHAAATALLHRADPHGVDAAASMVLDASPVDVDQDPDPAPLIPGWLAKDHPTDEATDVDADRVVTEPSAESLNLAMSWQATTTAPATGETSSVPTVAQDIPVAVPIAPIAHDDAVKPGPHVDLVDVDVGDLGDDPLGDAGDNPVDAPVGAPKPFMPEVPRVAVAPSGEPSPMPSQAPGPRARRARCLWPLRCRRPACWLPSVLSSRSRAAARTWMCRSRTVLPPTSRQSRRGEPTS